MLEKKLIIGLDVGSTTVKGVVIDPMSRKILWKNYKRHETRQPELVKEFLETILSSFSKEPSSFRIFITGSGGGTVAPFIGARFVHEVSAVTLSVEENHSTEAGSVVELGGQDAKIIIWKEDPNTGERQLFTSMNDKCAGGTGATIDKIVAKVGIGYDELKSIHFNDEKLHNIAGKCGVFAETDVVNLLKASVPADEIMVSLADAIIKQNLSVLTRGNILRDKVFLLGGPNTFLPFLQEGWRKRIFEIWEERNWKPNFASSSYPNNIDELIVVPSNAEYYAAFGSALFGLEEREEVGLFSGIEELREYIEKGRKNKLMQSGAKKGLVKSEEEYKQFMNEYITPSFRTVDYEVGSVVEAFMGIDGGSTSTKAVLMNKDKELLAKSYQLSNGNPIQDAKDIFLKLKKEVGSKGAKLEIKGLGATGYAADIIEKTMLADVNLVETVAHMRSALYYFGDIDVIVDVGGQDIKVLFMEHGRVKDFRLNTQCSAGNGYFLQGMAEQFGIDIRDYAKYAFQAEIAPVFNYGCAVFMEQDKVNFQQQGWTKEELMAGLALVLPLNIWQYVVQEPNLKKYGNRFVLQGGTQYNLAAVKSQVDYIKSKIPGASVMTHPHCGESGAIGACLEAIEVVAKRGHSSFIGIDQASLIEYVTTTNEDTKCTFCSNNCSRTFIDTKTPNGFTVRYISGFSCDKGLSENKESLKEFSKANKALKKKYPNLVDYSSRLAFKSFSPKRLSSSINIQVEEECTGFLGIKKKVQKERPIAIADNKWLDMRANIRIGMPKVLNMYSTAPLWRTYFESLGVLEKNIVFSDYTSEELWSKGSKWGSIDPCFPSKVANAHIHNLIYKKSTEKKPLDLIFFPIMTHLNTSLVNVQDNASCPIASGCSEVSKAAFTREKDIFKENNIRFYNPSFKMDEENLFKDQLYKAFKDLLGVSKEESDWAFNEAKKAFIEFDRLQKEKGLELINELERAQKVAVLMIGRPYHNDPGLNHDILESLQLTGFPILSMQSLPHDKDFLNKLFGSDLEKSVVTDPMDITDVWKNCYSENSSYKIWAAKVAARHPNLAVVDLSNFKCGHDAPIYNVIDGILKVTKTPYFTFHDIDENKPSGSIKIRTKTIKYFLDHYEEELRANNAKEEKLQIVLDRKYEELMLRYERVLKEGLGGETEEEALFDNEKASYKQDKDREYARASV